jgi:phospholipid/cholesterol/gamma-HCH transport system ATP-binding protein
MIEISGLRKQLGGRWIINGLDLIIPTGQMTCIIGRSGEGKSVLLKQIIGLIKPTSGSIKINGIEITTLEDEKLQEVFRTCGYVFQFAALLDSLTVFENIGITLFEKGLSRNEILVLVKEKLALVGLKEDVLYKYPSEISGGMKKRVGLARTLMENPSIMLYDEPTTGLDPITTCLVHELMYYMQKNLRLTSLVISHDVGIFKYADNVAFLHEGIIKFFGKAAVIWESKDPYIYQFIRGLAQGPIHTELSQAL